MTDQNTAADVTGHKPLSFDTDTGANRSTWIAAILLIAILVWMGSGFILPSQVDETQAEQIADAPVAVAVRTSMAEPVTLYFQAEGQAQPDRDTVLRAEISGDVAEVFVKKGDDVSEGQIIARLSSDRLQADLRRAEQDLERVQRDFDNATALLDRGVGTNDRVSDANADLAAAQAQLITAQTGLDSVDITAPFGGRIETLSLDAGEFVSAGSDVGRIVDNRPLTVALQVPQQALNRLKNGQPAEVQFITGETRSGEVSFVGTSAAAETRTFLAEITVPNADGAIPAGISAEIRIPTGEAQGHFISPSIVSLNSDGETGIKAVQDNIVIFHPIQVVRAEIDGIWVTGLPDNVNLITVGQGFVRAGETVASTPENNS